MPRPIQRHHVQTPRLFKKFKIEPHTLGVTHEVRIRLGIYDVYRVYESIFTRYKYFISNVSGDDRMVSNVFDQGNRPEGSGPCSGKKEEWRIER
jgi:hypothetical protein